MVDEKMINEAMENRFDGIESCVIVEELLELEAENIKLRKALQKIWDGGGTPKTDFYHKIAKQVLKED